MGSIVRQYVVAGQFEYPQNVVNLEHIMDALSDEDLHVVRLSVNIVAGILLPSVSLRLPFLGPSNGCAWTAVTSQWCPITESHDFPARQNVTRTWRLLWP